MAGSAKATTDHQVIQRWVEGRGGIPAHVKTTGDRRDVGMLRIQFREEENLEPISWTDWFAAFEENGLAFLFDDDPQSRFNKLVSRDNPKLADEEIEGQVESESMNPIEMLRMDHEQVRAGLSVLSRDGFSPEVFEQVKVLVEVHSEIEEKLFYPAVRRISGEMEEIIDKAIEDHHEVDGILVELDAEETGGDVRRLVEDLVDGLEAHLGLEESTIFPAVEKGVDASELERLGHRMIEMRREITSARDFPRALDREAESHAT